MGQVMRIMTYDRAENERNAVGALDFVNHPSSQLQWVRLDDGVMGGQSSTVHSCTTEGSLHFTGEINTNGGGFCSIRAAIPNGLPAETQAIRLKVIGDGKTYKLLLSDGSRSTFGPSKRSPSWQFDLKTTDSNGGKEPQEIVVPVSSLVPSWGGGPRGQPTSEEREQAQFNVQDMKEIGIMLSLQLSDGSPNPKETFGEGIFPFSLQVTSIVPE